MSLTRDACAQALASRSELRYNGIVGTRQVSAWVHVCSARQQVYAGTGIRRAFALYNVAAGRMGAIESRLG